MKKISNFKKRILSLIIAMMTLLTIFPVRIFLSGQEKWQEKSNFVCFLKVFKGYFFKKTVLAYGCKSSWKGINGFEIKKNRCNITATTILLIGRGELRQNLNSQSLSQFLKLWWAIWWAEKIRANRKNWVIYSKINIFQPWPHGSFFMFFVEIIKLKIYNFKYILSIKIFSYFYKKFFCP